jgi:hypothetical protein
MARQATRGMWMRRTGRVKNGRWGGERRFGNSVRAWGGACGERRLGSPGLVEIVFRYGFRLDGIEVGGLVEVAGVLWD